eukprot:12094009-Heterocapsa_arctica.AAC.1
MVIGLDARGPAAACCSRGWVRGAPPNSWGEGKPTRGALFPVPVSRSMTGRTPATKPPVLLVGSLEPLA